MSHPQGPSPTFICPNPSCHQEFLDLEAHLSDPDTPCEQWALENLQATLQDSDDEAAQEGETSLFIYRYKFLMYS